MKSFGKLGKFAGEALARSEMLHRHRKDIVQALKSPLLQERLAAINKEPSSFILQQNLDRDSDLREFLSTCLEAVGALKSVKDEAGDKKYEFDGTGIVKKKSHD